MDATGTPGGGGGLDGSWARDGVRPDDVTAPRPIVTGPHPHHHEGAPATAHHGSAPGHHVVPPPQAGPPSGPRRALLAVAGVTAGVLVLGTVGAVALSRVGGSASAAGTPSTVGSPGAAGLTPAAAEPADATDTATPPPLPPAQPTLVLGDSLGLDVYPWLADLLPDRYVSYEAQVGRSTPATEKALDAMGSVPPVVVVSSGTNDPVANVLEESARRILDRLGPARCVVWVDVVRPDRVGDAQTTMNAALDRAVSGRPNVRVLRWTDLVAAHPEWMSGDGIHPGEAGAQARARAFAGAARGCSALDPSAAPARRQILPRSAFWGPVSGQYRPPSPSGGTATGSPSGGALSATPTSTSSGTPGGGSPAPSSATASSGAPATSSAPGTDSAPPAASSPTGATSTGPASTAASTTAAPSASGG